jgi:hypothetical protein
MRHGPDPRSPAPILGTFQQQQLQRVRTMSG